MFDFFNRRGERYAPPQATVCTITIGVRAERQQGYQYYTAAIATYTTGEVTISQALQWLKQNCAQSYPWLDKPAKREFFTSKSAPDDVITVANLNTKVNCGGRVMVHYKR